MDDGEREESGKDFEVEVADVSRSGQIRTEQGLSPRQRFWRLASAIGVVALVLLVLVLDVSGRLNPQQFLPKPPPPLILRPRAQGMRCLLDAAWSPRSTRIALLGSQYDVACPDFSPGRHAGLVTVYNAGSGKVLAALHPDDAVVPAIQAFAQRVAPTATTPAATQVAPEIVYQHVLWSADGKRLALTFSVDPNAIGLHLYLPDGDPVDLFGVVLLDANGAHPRVLMHSEGTYEQVPFEWDLQAGATLAAPASPYPTFGVLPPAVAYRWQPDGSLATDTLLSTDAPPPVPPLGAVGNPDGGSSFTIWQPGLVTGVAELSPNGLLTNLPGVYTLSAAFVAWSPDGRYLLDVIIPEGLLELPTTPPPTQDQLNAYGVAGVLFLPLRDAGLAQALRALNPINRVGTSLAWRPDGRVLAAYAPENVFAPHPLIIYDCATGRQLAALLPPAVSETSRNTSLIGQSTILLRWSPDGTHLLLFALALGQVVVWGPDQLPR